MPVESGICPYCKREIDLKASNVDPEDCFHETDCFVLVEHHHEDGTRCDGSDQHTATLLEKDYGDDDGLTLADVLEAEEED